MIGSPRVTLTASPERETFDRDQTLVVITGDDKVEFTAGRSEKDRIARERSTNIDSGSLTAADGWHHLPLLFIAKEPTLSGVGIDAGQGQPWSIDAVMTSALGRQVG
jgi:hypothetical protein